MRFKEIISLYEPAEQNNDEGFSAMEIQRILNKTEAKMNKKAPKTFRKTSIFVAAAVLVCIMSITALAVVYRCAIWERLLGPTTLLDDYITTEATLIADSEHYRYTVNETLFTSDSACIIITMEPIDEYGKENLLTEEIELSIGFIDANGNSPKAGCTISQTEEEATEGTRRIMLRQTFIAANVLSDGMTMNLGIIRYDEAYGEDSNDFGVLGEITLITSTLDSIASNGYTITIQLDADAYTGKNYRYNEVNITPLGIKFTGSFEDSDNFVIPEVDFTVIFIDGTEVNSTDETRKSMNANDPNYNHYFIGGGGDGDPRTGELVWGLSFAQVIDIYALTGIRIDGVYYPISIDAEG